MRKLLLLLMVISMIALVMKPGLAAEDQTSRQSKPELANVTIAPPDPQIEPDVRKFSGIWEGRWSNFPHCPQWHGLNAKMAIKSVVKDGEKYNATLTYAWGDSPEWHTKKGSSDYSGEIKKNDEGRWELFFKSPRRPFKFYFDKDSLFGVTGTSEATLRRIN
ncbi:MAG: hypothetical protein HY790_14890 [Deltaproteobacteria bacterium]|nr:hypothetical protein [Deltaproteobacteria bacterium]